MAKQNQYTTITLKKETSKQLMLLKIKKNIKSIDNLICELIKKEK